VLAERDTRKRTGRPRRWARKAPSDGIDAVLGVTLMTIVNVSYGGVRLRSETPIAEGLGKLQTLELPGAGLTVNARPLWIQGAAPKCRKAAPPRTAPGACSLTRCALTRRCAPRSNQESGIRLILDSSRFFFLLGGHLVVSEELVGEILELGSDHLAWQIAELLAQRAHRDHRFGHRAVAAGAADVGEEAPHELAGVLRVTEIADRDHQRIVDDAGDDRPLHVLELQEEVGDVGDEVIARQRAQERAEHLL